MRKTFGILTEVLSSAIKSSLRDLNCFRYFTRFAAKTNNPPDDLLNQKIAVIQSGAMNFDVFPSAGRR
jgi:hypothetical protein